MLGVIGIHVGSYALQNPFVNLELISVLEILSLWVPAFFFLSAFGLFYHTSVEGPFSYKRNLCTAAFRWCYFHILRGPSFTLLYTGVTAHNLVIYIQGRWR